MEKLLNGFGQDSTFVPGSHGEDSVTKEAMLSSIDNDKSTVAEPQLYNWPEFIQLPVPSVPESDDVISHGKSCCALKDCPSDSPDTLRVNHFQYWVAYKLANDPSIPRSDQVSCPMVWCDAFLGEPAKLIDHIQNCEYLTSYLYWCPYCQTEENFAYPSLKKSRRGILKNACDTISASLQGVSNILSTAADRRDRLKFLKGFRPPLRFSRGNMYEPEGTELSSDNSISSRGQGTQVPKINNGTRLSIPAVGWSLDWEWDASLGSFPELAANSEMAMSQGQVAVGETASRNKNVNELTTVRDPLASKKRFSGCMIFELDGNPISSNNSCDQNEFSKTNIHTPASPCTPLSSVDDDTRSSSTRTHCITDSDSINNVQNYGRPASLWCMEQSGLLTRLSYDKMQDEDVTMLEMIIETLHQRYEDIIQRLSCSVMHPSVSSFIEELPSNDQLTHQGMTAFERFFCGHLPASILEIVGMVHVAYAFALAMDHHQDLATLHTNFYADVLHWGQAIHPTDRTAFEEITERLWKPILSLELENPFMDSSTPPTGLSLSSIRYQHNNLLIEEDATLSCLSGELTIVGLLDSLGKGKIVRSFVRSLNVIESDGLILQRLKVTPCYTNTSLDRPEQSQEILTGEIMNSEILEPLLIHRGLEAFHPVVKKNGKLLKQGKIHGIRDLELRLMKDARLYSQNDFLLTQFLDAVTHQGDLTRLMISQEPQYRYHHYIEDIKVLRNILQAHNGDPRSSFTAFLQDLENTSFDRQLSSNDIISTEQKPIHIVDTDLGQRQHDFRFKHQIPTLKSTQTPEGEIRPDSTMLGQLYDYHEAETVSYLENSPTSSTRYSPTGTFSSTPSSGLHSNASPSTPISSVSSWTDARAPGKSLSRKANLTIKTSAIILDQPTSKNSTNRQNTPSTFSASTPSTGNSSMISPSSSSPRSQSSNKPVKLSCPSLNCRSVFTGKRKFAQLNRKRHLKTLHSPIKSEWTCDYQGCGKVIKNRKDNFQHHRKAVHGLID